MTKSELELKGIRAKKDIADADRRQKEKSDERNARASIASAGIKSFGSLLGKMNDSSWYKKLIGGVPSNTSVPDFTPIGTVDTRFQANGNIPVIPSVIRINYAPTIGYTRRSLTGSAVVNTIFGTDPVNRALNRVGTQLEMRNSRVSSYSRDTIGRYFFMANDVACNLCRLKMAIDVYNMADATKPFVARQLIRALGFNYMDFSANISAYKTAYVSMANEFNQSLPLPSDLSFVKRQMWMSSTLIKDSKGAYATYIVFNRYFQFRIPNANDLAGEKLDNYISDLMPDTGLLFRGFTGNIRSTIHALVNGATWKPLIRDLRGGTRDSSWIKLPTDATVKTITISDIDEVREQIHNLDTLPLMLHSGVDCFGLAVRAFSIGGGEHEEVTQNLWNGLSSNFGNEAFAKTITPGSVIFGSETLAPSSALSQLKGQYDTIYPNANFVADQIYSMPKILSQHKDTISSDDVLVSTRLKQNHTFYLQDVTVNNTDKIYISTDGEAVVKNANGSYQLGILQPTQYGTEMVLFVETIIDRPDDDNSNINTCACPNIAYDEAGMLQTGNRTFISTDISGFGSEDDQNGMRYSLTQYFSPFSTVDWFPIVYLKLGGADSFIGELEHYTIIEASLLGKINEQCLESEFTLSEQEYLKPLAGN